VGLSSLFLVCPEIHQAPQRFIVGRRDLGSMKWQIIVAGIILAVVAACGCLSPGQPEGLTVSSGAFAPGGAIPAAYSCDSDNISPPISWSHVPPETKSLALTIIDTDVAPPGFTHWIIYDIPPAGSGLPSSVPAVPKLPDGSSQGLNGAGKVGYTGTCPPRGSVHHYHFTLYALDIMPAFSGPVNRTVLESEMAGHILQSAELIGVFSR
jgi:Raf kinase inhibitor-like YbhB/YbcL family protein